MVPTSDQLEAFQERLQRLDGQLAKLKGTETKGDLVAELKAVARDWLRISDALRAADAVPKESTNDIDTAIREILESTNARTRSSAYQKRLDRVRKNFMQGIIIPVIRFEGSPSQVAARQLMGAIAANATAEEQTYLEEAAKCLSRNCNRAAIIMIWAAAIARFHRAVEKLGFNTYNASIAATTQKKGAPFNKVHNVTVNSLPELQRSKDYDLLVIGMDLWKYDGQVFSELERLLGIRNDAAHPGMLAPSALDVQQFGTKVNDYVFAKVPR